MCSFEEGGTSFREGLKYETSDETYQEYEEIQNARKSAELMEESLKNHYLNTKNNNEQGI